jgi:hypothetical protein
MSFRADRRADAYGEAVLPTRHRITVPIIAGRGTVATFLAVSDQPETITDTRVVGGTRRVDTAWVHYPDGMAGLVCCFDIRGE